MKSKAYLVEVVPKGGFKSRLFLATVISEARKTFAISSILTSHGLDMKLNQKAIILTDLQTGLGHMTPDDWRLDQVAHGCHKTLYGLDFGEISGQVITIHSESHGTYSTYAV